MATLSRSQKKKLRETAAKLGDPAVDFVIESSRQAAGRPGLHTPEAIALANRLGFAELLGA